MKLQYIKILVLVFFIFPIMSCNGQKDDKIIKEAKSKNSNKEINSSNKKSNIPNKKNKVMKKLDKNKLEKFKKNNQFSFKENDSIFKLDDQDKTYREVKNKIGEKLKTVSFYDKNKLVLLAEGNYMYDCPIGIHISYDLEGNIIKKQNFDEGFTFTFLNLKQKLQKEANINIDDTSLDLSISRGIDKKYYLTLYAKDRTSYRSIVIDGATGKILEDLNVRALD